MNKLFKPASAEELAARGIFPHKPVDLVKHVVAKVVKPKKASTKGAVL